MHESFLSLRLELGQPSDFQDRPSSVCAVCVLPSSTLLVSTVMLVDLIICCWLVLECSSSSRSHCEPSFRRKPPFDGMLSALSCVPPSPVAKADVPPEGYDEPPNDFLNSLRSGGREQAMIPSPASKTDQRMV